MEELRDPARQAIESLGTRGIGWREIAQAVGVSSSAIQRWAACELPGSGKPSSGKPRAGVIGTTRTLRVFAYAVPCDLRKGYDGLGALVAGELGRDPLSGNCFLFTNARRWRLADNRIRLDTQSAASLRAGSRAGSETRAIEGADISRVSRL